MSTCHILLSFFVCNLFHGIFWQIICCTHYVCWFRINPLLQRVRHYDPLLRNTNCYFFSQMYRKCTMILQNDPLFENDNITVTHERHLGLWDLKWEIFIGPDHIVYPIADKLTNPLALTNALETWCMWWLFSASRGSHVGNWALRVSGTAKFGSNCGQDIRLRFGHNVKLFDRDFEADF